MIIFATNIHQGGGLVLLRSLLKALPSESSGHFFCDERSGLGSAASVPTKWEVHVVRPSLGARLQAERQLRSMAGPKDSVLCFGNLPPLFRLKSERVYTFFQNRNLLPDADLGGFPLASRIKHGIESIWLKQARSHVSQFIVQSPSMETSLRSMLGAGSDVRSLPFAPEAMPSGSPTKARFDFLYPASGEPHKNHENLLQAWRELARQGLRPTLALTIDPSAHRDLSDRIEMLRAEHRLEVLNLGKLDRSRVLELYWQSRCLIFPSMNESFGLPLLEARTLGLPIVASELDFVRDIANPRETFDPNSPRSIARAAQRFLRVPYGHLELVPATQWYGIIERGERE